MQTYGELAEILRRNGKLIAIKVGQTFEPALERRSYWIPGSSAPALPEKGNALLRPLKK
jgi:hypothetical protein